MKVQELIDRLAGFRGDAVVVFWDHNEYGGFESSAPIVEVNRDSNGTVGINWNEGGKSPVFTTRELLDV